MQSSLPSSTYRVSDYLSGTHMMIIMIMMAVVVAVMVIIIIMIMTITFQVFIANKINNIMA